MENYEFFFLKKYMNFKEIKTEGYSTGASCEVSCDMIEDLQTEISSLASVLGTSEDCLPGVSGISNGEYGISVSCPETVFGGLNKVLNLLGKSDNCFDNSNDCYLNVFGILNGMNHKIGDVSDYDNNNSMLGNNTIFGLLRSVDCGQGDCGSKSICERLDNLESKLSQIQDSINGISCSSQGSSCPPCPTISSSPSCLDIAKIVARVNFIMNYNAFDPEVVNCNDFGGGGYYCELAERYNSLSTKDWGCGV